MDAKANAPFDPFRSYPEFNLSDLPSDMPPEYKERMRTLLPYVALNPAVENLVYTTHDASGALVSTSPVLNRPWEWTEYLGDSPAGEPVRSAAEDRMLDGRPHVRNTSAFPLELFDARVTGDRIIPPSGPSASASTSGSRGAKDDMMAEESLHSLQDDVYAESVFRRDWRETRISLDDDVAGGQNASARAKTELEEAPPPLPAFSGHALGVGALEPRPLSRRPSPASSVRSVASALGSITSRRQSPAHPLSRLSVSTAGEIIDVDAFDGHTSVTGSSNKRKVMSTIVEDDDEIEIIDGPGPSITRATKRTKASKTTAKRKK